MAGVSHGNAREKNLRELTNVIQSNLCPREVTLKHPIKINLTHDNKIFLGNREKSIEPMKLTNCSVVFQTTPSTSLQYCTFTILALQRLWLSLCLFFNISKTVMIIIKVFYRSQLKHTVSLYLIKFVCTTCIHINTLHHNRASACHPWTLILGVLWLQSQHSIFLWLLQQEE